jgi:hypothetical protein
MRCIGIELERQRSNTDRHRTANDCGRIRTNRESIGIAGDFGKCRCDG